MENRDKDYTINSVQRSLNILKLFIPKNQSLSLMEISTQSGLNKSTALRMISTLREEGFLKVDPKTKRYKLGTAALQIGLSALDSLNLSKIAKPILNELADKTGCFVHLGIFDSDQVVVIAKVYPIDRPISVNLLSQIGGILPVYCTGFGLLFLSQLTDMQARKILNNTEFVQYTSTTITDIDDIMQRVKEIRHQGYCINNGEHEEGVVSFCYPIYEHSGEIAAALSIGGIREVIYKTNEEAESLQSMAKAAAAKISKELGYNP